MRRDRRWFRALRLVVPVTALAVVAALTPGGAATAQAPASTAQTAAPVANVTQVSRAILRRASLVSLSAGQGHLPPGTKGPEFPQGSPEPAGAAKANRPAARFVNRSHSPRPDPRRLPAAAAGSLPIPVAQSTPVNGTKPGLNKSFEGLNLFQERYVANNGNQFSFEPPDQGMCVGNGYVLETINDALRVFDTEGRAKSVPIDLNSFYGYPAVIDRNTGISGPQLTDPSCLYDSVNHRWIHITLTLDTAPDTGALTLNNHIDIAVSKTASPLGGWNFYSVNATDDGRAGTPRHTDCPCIGDYPHIGADRNGVYITTNEYPWDTSPGIFGTNFNGAQLYAFSRHALTSGAAHVRVTQLSNLVLAGGSHPVPAFTLIAANSPDGVFADADGGSEYFLSSAAAQETGNAAGRSNVVGLWTLRNTRSLDGGHLAIELAAQTVSSEVYGVPPLSSQKIGSVPLRDCILVGCSEGTGPAPGEVEGPLDSSDSRMFNTWYAHGRIWGSLSTIVSVAGNIQAGAAWFQLTPSGAMTHQGYVANAHNNVIYPGIATLADGTGAMAINLVGRDWYPTAAYARVTASGPHDIHIAAAGAGPQDGFCEYNFFNCASTEVPFARPRWGDYPAAQASGGSIWVASEYIAQTCTFGQYLTDFTCGNRRGSVANWSTRLSRVTPR